jgi:hypothetical protein
MAFVAHSALLHARRAHTVAACGLSASTFRASIAPVRVTSAPVKNTEMKMQVGTGTIVRGISPEDGEKGTVIVLGGDGFCGTFYT